MKRLVISLLFFLVVSLAVGLLLSGSEFLDWGLAGGLFAIAVAGEGLRFWLGRSRAKKRESSGI
ncbi:hypothetical protein [Kribbella pratensis]|uniref:Uncharacterized protein n=1 Tax=Kribbella pratensis TaxID=2512112 RepID=A0A4R8BSX0_9ACTN|nr:hypothetical protein [Kribbella pratensis]TDW60916.1 hypothetical protein EV653_7475 [Kribbella pratensis]